MKGRWGIVGHHKASTGTADAWDGGDSDWTLGPAAGSEDPDLQLTLQTMRSLRYHALRTIGMQLITVAAGLYFLYLL